MSVLVYCKRCGNWTSGSIGNKCGYCKYKMEAVPEEYLNNDLNSDEEFFSFLKEGEEFDINYYHLRLNNVPIKKKLSDVHINGIYAIVAAIMGTMLGVFLGQENTQDKILASLNNVMEQIGLEKSENISELAIRVKDIKENNDTLINTIDTLSSKNQELTKTIDKLELALDKEKIDLEHYNNAHATNDLKDSILELRLISSDFYKYTDVQNELNELKTKYTTQILDAAYKMIETSDFISAINMYKECLTVIGDSPEIDEHIERCKQEYKTSIFSDADEIFNKSGYDAAIKVLNSASPFIDKNELSDKITEYNNRKPISLFNVDTYLESGYLSKKPEGTSLFKKNDSGIFKDNYGTTYTIGIYRWPPNFSIEDTFIECLVDDYTKFAGTIILDYNQRATDSIGYLKIYGDNNLIYTSPNITRGIKPISIDLDISDISLLRIEFAGSYTIYTLINPILFK